MSKFTPPCLDHRQEHTISISVIVPIYNSAKFVDGLMDSVLNQSFKDFELICVNDGSKDNSLEQLREWAEKDKRIVIIDKPNGGVSSARNTGIEKARGKYIWFHDHDDYAFPDTLETMFNEVEDRDILIAGWLKTNDKNKIKELERTKCVTEKVMANNIEEMCEKIPFGGWIGVIWRCLFKRSVLTENNISFRQLNHEDTLFVYEFLSKCKSCSRVNFQGYVFLDTPDSLGSSHRYNVNEQWLELAHKAAKNCFKAFKIGKRSMFNGTLHRLYIPHCVSFVTTGYHTDSTISYPRRIERWNYLSKNKFWNETQNYGFITRFQKIIWYICRYRLYYIADPFLLLLTRVHDKIIYRK